MEYLRSWDRTIASKNGSTALASRPPPLAMLSDNTTVQGSWIYPVDMEAESARHGRIIDNITMAMPHAGVLEATALEENQMHPQSNLNVSTKAP